MATVGERTTTDPTGTRATQGRSGMVVPRVFSSEGVSPFDQVDWELRTAEIKDERGRIIFQQTDCEIPQAWSQLATNVVASKYFYGELNTPERETSVRQLIGRVTRTIADWGREDGYFASAEDAERFYDELTALCLHQYGSFNSPVWFNVGLYHRYGIEGPANNWRWDEETRSVVRVESAYKYPQGSACFIQSVADDMQDIMRLATAEAMLFKFGSGTGTDLSTLRSSRERLSGGGRPSGPVSFMRVYDAIASVVKSGGKTRRAAKMQTLKVHHPDILEFIECKAKEERKAQTLIRSGYEANFNGEAYSSVMFQNANLSVRASDAFLRAVEGDAEWTTRAVTTGRPMQSYRARLLMDKIAEGTWLCGDPGLQYEDTIQRWHTCPNTAPINSSNPCSEYMFIDDSACNLASINLMKFRGEDGSFDAERFRAACRIFITAQEILVDRASYPTDRITVNSHKFRPLGLGYANLGCLIMSSGFPYDSDQGRGLAGVITSIMHGQAYLTSAEHAAHVGPFDGFALNREPMLRVMEMHRDAVEAIDASVPADLLAEARAVWDACLEMGRRHGYRNSQVTVLAPTGTIAFMMDCDTTGVEPDIALVKYKQLAGGGMLKIVNRTVPMALRKLGYDEPVIRSILDYVDAHDTIEGAPGLRDAHLAVFDCAFPPPQGGRSIHFRGHLRMMAAVQPFLSGAISKCVVGETLVATTEGLVRIGGLYGGESPDSFRESALDLASLGGTRRTDAFYYGGRRPVLKVALRSGHQITGTPNHRLLVAVEGGLEWRELAEIQPCDHVALRYGADLWSAAPARLDGFVATPAYGGQESVKIPTEMTEGLAFLLGAYCAEGSMTRSDWAVHITNSADSVLERVAAAWRGEFGIEAVVHRPVAGCPSVMVASEAIVEFLDFLGCGDRASAKRIPDAVLRSPRPMVLAFLRGLSLGANVSVKSMPRWAICLDSPALLDDLQAVFTNLGISHARINKYKFDDGKSCDEVYATGAQARELVRLIPFLEPEKAARAALLRERSCRVGRRTSDLVPGVVRGDLYRAIPAGKSGRYGRSPRRGNTALSDPRTEHVSRRMLERVAAIPGVVLPEWLQTVLRDNLHFSPVASVEDAGEHEVYDLSVPVTHAFVGNGIVNHNTCNVPNEATIADIRDAYLEGWRLGLKALAIYRDGSKGSQPVSTKSETEGTSADSAKAAAPRPAEPGPVAPAPVPPLPPAPVPAFPAPVPANAIVQPRRERLPYTRRSLTHKFDIQGHEGYVNVGFYPDGRPGELFITMAKEGSTIGGLMDVLGTSISIGLQYGVPLEVFVNKFAHSRFEPAGFTKNPDIPIAKSIADYIFRWLGMEFIPGYREANAPQRPTEEPPTAPVIKVNGHRTATIADLEHAEAVREVHHGQHGPVVTPSPLQDGPEGREKQFAHFQSDAPPCDNCGALTVRCGTCYRCFNCGASMGCS